jgi:hypothetical protein
MSKIVKWLVVVLFCCISTYSQMIPPKVSPPTSCETNTLLLDLVAGRLKQDAGSASERSIILVSTLSSSEGRKTYLHRRRLFTIQSYLMDRGVDIPIVSTSSVDVAPSFATVRIFVNGSVAATLVVGKCEDIPILVCDDKAGNAKYYLSGRLRRKCHR